VGFAGRDAKKEKEGFEGVKADLAMFEQYYLKDGKFVGGFATPTIADLSICGGLTFLRVLGYEHTPATKAYLARVAAAVPSWTATTVCVTPFCAALHRFQHNPFQL
jgi:glutathione S-transferase